MMKYSVRTSIPVIDENLQLKLKRFNLTFKLHVIIFELLKIKNKIYKNELNDFSIQLHPIFDDLKHRSSSF